MNAIVGKDGIEAYYDPFLRGAPTGIVLARADAVIE